LKKSTQLRLYEIATPQRSQSHKPVLDSGANALDVRLATLRMAEVKQERLFGQSASWDGGAGEIRNAAIACVERNRLPPACLVAVVLYFPKHVRGVGATETWV
jgi:hypothetical protein